MCAIDTSGSWITWNDLQKPGKETESKNPDLPDYITVKSS